MSHYKCKLLLNDTILKYVEKNHIDPTSEQLSQDVKGFSFHRVALEYDLYNHCSSQILFSFVKNLHGPSIMHILAKY